MKIAIVVSSIESEQPVYATILVARAALRRGHEVWFVDTSGLAWDPDGRVRARARAAPRRSYDSGEDYLADLTCPPARRQRLVLDEVDLLWLRNEPGFDATERPWAVSLCFAFGRAVQDAGVTVLSDPDGLARAIADKLYSQRLAPDVRPRTLVTRDAQEALDFVAELGDAVVKPLQGASGAGLFVVRRHEENLREIVETVRRLGYVVVQERLPAAANGTIRLFMLDGRPLELDGRIAAVRHVPRLGDVRSNFRVSGTIAPAELGEDALRVAAAVGPQLAADGLFLVGLDIAGDRLLEANVFSPGGLTGAERLEGVPFSDAVVAAMEERAAR